MRCCSTPFLIGHLRREAATTSGFDAVFVAGSVHYGHHQAALFKFVRDHRSALRSRPGAFVSVSLSMASDDKVDRLGAAECADRFLSAAEWKPTVIHLVACALRYTRRCLSRASCLRNTLSLQRSTGDLLNAKMQESRRT